MDRRGKRNGRYTRGLYTKAKRYTPEARALAAKYKREQRAKARRLN